MLDSKGIRSILVIAPHADDEVLGAGGLMMKAARQGAKVHVVFMAVDALKHWGLDHPTTLDGRIREIDDVAARLQFTYEIFYSGKDLIEQLDTVSQREMVNLFEDAYNRHRPDLLLLPHGEDFDQDHRHTYRAAFAAARPIPQSLSKFFPKNIWTYEIPKIIWSDAPFKPHMYVDITDAIDDKIDGVKLYPSQLREEPHIRSPENVRALAYLRGSEIGVDYAEAFHVLRSVLD
jgi:LmbE family N-acetylglucosaminyl deacetylase